MSGGPARRWERWQERPRAGSSAVVEAPEAAAPQVPQGPRAAHFKIRKEAPAPSRASTWVACVLFALTALAGYWLSTGRADAEFVQARKLVVDNERGKAPETINYSDPLYDEAIERLSAIDPGSASGVDATQLLAEIQAKRKAFHQRLLEAQARMDEARLDQEARAAALLAAQEASTGTDAGAAQRQYEAAPAAPGCQDEGRHQRRKAR